MEIEDKKSLGRILISGYLGLALMVSSYGIHHEIEKFGTLGNAVDHYMMAISNDLEKMTDAPLNGLHP
jgi:hypothetical protein